MRCAFQRKKRREGAGGQKEKGRAHVRDLQPLSSAPSSSVRRRTHAILLTTRCASASSQNGRRAAGWRRRRAATTRRPRSDCALAQLTHFPQACTSAGQTKVPSASDTPKTLKRQREPARQRSRTPKAPPCYELHQCLIDDGKLGCGKCRKTPHGCYKCFVKASGKSDVTPEIFTEMCIFARDTAAAKGTPLLMPKRDV
jgi:hypothetical protein